MPQPDSQNRDAIDAALEAAILWLLAQRARGKTICPSEAARLVAGDDEKAWRPFMEPARQAARRLVAAGRVVIVQRGRLLDSEPITGPIRLKLP